jgi:pilus assembly protein TadC
MSIFETISTKQKTKKKELLLEYHTAYRALPKFAVRLMIYFFQFFCSNDQVFYQKKRSRKARCGREFIIFSRLKESENVLEMKKSFSTFF